MTDKYAQIREALAAGPTPGPWEISGISQDDGSISVAKGQIVLCYVTNAASFFEVVQGQHPDTQFANARMIAACHPLAIAELLAERDRLREALQAAVDCGMVPKSSARDGGGGRHSEQVRVADMIRAALSEQEQS